MAMGSDRTGVGDADKAAVGIAGRSVDCGTGERGAVEGGTLVEAVELL